MARRTRRAAGTGAASDRLEWSVAGVGLAVATAAIVADAAGSRSAASQDWPPFVFVFGLLLLGWVAEHDGLFEAAGHRIGRLTSSGGAFFVAAVVVIGTVTALLNLDTSVAFLTPVLIYTARSRGMGEGPALYGSLLLANAGSLLLPGSNLTNLIVLAHDRLRGTAFLAVMWAPALCALTATAVVVAVATRRELAAPPAHVARRTSRGLGVGLIGVPVAAAVVLVDPAPALPVAAIGVASALLTLARTPRELRAAARAVSVPLLAGLLGVAIALGALGRAWTGPATLVAHLNAAGTAAVAALAAVACNNLPAASLLAARTPEHPFALLIGLNLGPNLFVTGSLAWLLWLKAARSAGAQPSLRRASGIGLVAVPASMAAALAVLTAQGH